ncbi:50S ribosomal protein L25 [Stieleria sp. ICT_E10.1]|uniref:50S ribosomal protein L25 n=1 Tax=Stieleria sedimenti TaxID=2976331 RepID=UPI0021808DD3|nr:50S ribosomal protein L25 [Stieleria sedimenti]MCS7465822.1 50S ribosomal protein L25 [Stieleria sedimenti]
MAEVVQVQKRDGSLGTAASRRLRKAGSVPAVLYGHKQQNQHLAISQKTVESILRHHSRIVELQGDVVETAMVSDLQFDPLGIEVLHIDLQRVDMNEKVTVTVPIRFKGEPIGGKQGGIVIENAHEVEVECPVVAIPDFVELNVTSVGLSEHRSASDVKLPENVVLVTPGETVVYHVEKVKGEDVDETEEEGEEA